MRSEIVLTLTGPDRVGIVDEVTEALLALGGNVESSRMSRLGGEFAILMLVSLPSERLDAVDAAFGRLVEDGYMLTTRRTERTGAESYPGWSRYRIEVHGADHEGIIHGIAHRLSQRGITIESAETETRQAPLTAAPLFSMTAEVAVPPGLDEREWRAELAEAAHEANVDVTVSSAGAR